MSMIMDHYGDKWARRWEEYANPQYPFPVPRPMPTPPSTVPMVSPEEIADFRILLERAREYDRKHNQPGCELESKRQRVRELAEHLGVKVDFV